METDKRPSKTSWNGKNKTKLFALGKFPMESQLLEVQKLSNPFYIVKNSEHLQEEMPNSQCFLLSHIDTTLNG